MEILILVIPLAGLFLFLRLRAFESTFAVLVGLPILVFPAASAISASWYIYLLGLVAACAISIFLQWEGRPGKDSYDIRAEAEPLFIFTAIFLVCFGFCNMWPDFIAIGERLRDYAILASILKSPVEPLEPWLAGYPMNYYVFWYRFGSIFHELFNMPVWKLYPALQSFTFALYCSATFLIFRRLIGFSLTTSLFCAIIIAFGSNIDGVLSAFREDPHWWGPSRVIKGAINEFPAWSFLLGDLHPHYINLPALAFFLVLLLPALRTPLSQLQSLFLASFAFILVPFFLYNSNAWELPFWLLSSSTIALFLLIRHFSLLEWRWEKLRELRSAKAALVIFLMLYSAFSLYLSSRHLVPVEAPLRMVRPPILQSTTGEMFRHFGFPLSLIALSTIALFPKRIYGFLAAILLGGTLLHSDAGLFLYTMLGLTFLRLLLEYVKEDQANSSDLILALEALGVASLALVLFPEFFFVDDAYGAESERMNTIFKVYTFNWLLLHMYGFFLAGRVLRGIKASQEVFIITKIFQLAVLFIFLAFFKHTIPLRLSDVPIVEPKSRGLSSVENEFHGAANTIEKLSSLPEGLVLESQGNPYSYTTHVATLAGKASYLGWANHVQLLIRDYEEIERREKVTEEFYKNTDCAKRKEILEKENISYAVVGPLEKERYGESVSSGFACLEKLLTEGDYQIFSNVIQSHN